MPGISRKSILYILLIAIILCIVLISIIALRFHKKAIAGSATGALGEGAPNPAVPLSGGSATVYVYGSKLIASKSGQVSYHYPDFLGSNRMTTDSAGKLMSRNVQYPYGRSVEEQSFAGSEQKYLFTGKEKDEDLYYFGARYFSPRIARFVSIDHLLSTFSNYDYVSNNPLKYVDPTGNAKVLWQGELLGRDLELSIPTTVEDIRARSVQASKVPVFGDISRLIVAGIDAYRQQDFGIFADEMECALVMSAMPAGGTAVSGIAEGIVAKEVRTVPLFHATDIKNLPKIFQEGTLKSGYTQAREDLMKKGLSQADAELRVAERYRLSPNKRFAWLSSSPALAEEFGGANNVIIEFRLPVELSEKELTVDGFIRGGKFRLPEVSTEYAVGVHVPLQSNMKTAEKVMKKYEIPVTTGVK
jgi:RHS repeat-associated protein